MFNKRKLTSEIYNIGYLRNVMYFYHYKGTIRAKLTNNSELILKVNINILEKKLSHICQFFIRVNKNHIINVLLVDNSYPYVIDIRGNKIKLDKKYSEKYLWKIAEIFM